MARKVAFAVAIAFLLALLGLFGDIGYHVNLLAETVTQNPNQAYPTVRSSLNLTFNPLLYPYYWLTGSGYISKDLSGEIPVSDSGQTLPPAGYNPPTHHAGTAPPPSKRPLTMEERYEDYIVFLAISGIVPNFVVLLSATLAIEAVRQRLLYMILFSGVIGFALVGITGTMIGLIIGGIFATTYEFKLQRRFDTKKAHIN